MEFENNQVPEAILDKLTKVCGKGCGPRIVKLLAELKEQGRI